jgi:hypothetical protein
MSGTYGTYAALYYSLGYGVPLPIPYGQKWPPPGPETGDPHCTGEYDAVDENQMAEWIRTHADYDIAIRVQPDMVMLDFDMYGDKTGKKALDEAENQWGPFPPTYSTTARLDGSKRGLYYLPDGCNSDHFKSEIKFTLSDGSEVGNIDIIRFGHRYFMTAPSRHHTGVDAFWLDPQGNECDIPELNRDNFPEFPRAWFDGLQKPESQSSVGDWTYGEGGDAGFRAFFKGVPIRSLGSYSNWHYWHYGEHIKLNAFHRAGRVSETEYREALQAIDERYVKGAAAAGETVDDRFDKVHEDAIAKVEGKKPEDVERELRNYPDNVSAKRSVEPDADFWDARPVLRQIRALARARLTAPYPVMGETLLRVAASTPPTVVLPPLRGGVASLNLFVALVGESGWGGKDTARDVAAMLVSDRSAVIDAHFSGDDVIPFQDSRLRFLTKMPGSGEGIPRLFGYSKKVSKDGDLWVMTFTEPNAVLMIASELDGLLAVGKRPGSTILPILRISYNGGTLGFTNSDQQRSIQIDAHTYRLALSVGVQPLRAAPLLDDADGGLPQRFLWMPCYDPGIRAWRERELPEPEWEVWQPPSFDGVTELSVPQQVIDAVIEAALPPLETDTRNPLNSHAVLAQEKVAALLGIHDRRTEVSVEDWQLADHLMKVSNRTRADVQATLARRAEETGEKRAVMKGKQADISDAHQHEAGVKRLVSNFAEKLCEDGDWVAFSHIKKQWTASRDRAYVEDALTTLVRTDRIEKRPSPEGHGGSAGWQCRSRK